MTNEPLTPDPQIIVINPTKSPNVVETFAAIQPSPNGDTESKFDLRYLTEGALPPLDWFARGLLVNPTYGELAGEKKSLKTYVMQIIQVALANGVPVFDKFPVPRKFTIASYIGEGGERGYRARLMRICDAYNVSYQETRKMLPITFHPRKVDAAEFEDTIRKAYLDYQPDIFWFDPWYRIASESVQTRDYVSVGMSLEKIENLIFRDLGTSVLVNNHFNQTGSGMDLDRITGAGHGEWVDSWILLRHRDPPNVAKGEFRLHMVLGNREWGGSEWDLDLSIGTFNEEANEHTGAVSWILERTSHVAAKVGKPKKTEADQEVLINKFAQQVYDVLAVKVLPFTNMNTLLIHIRQKCGLSFDQNWGRSTLRAWIDEDLLGVVPKTNAFFVRNNLQWSLRFPTISGTVAGMGGDGGG